MERFLGFVETAVREVLTDEYTRERAWDEDYLSRSLLRELVAERHHVLEYGDTTLSVTWDASFIPTHLQRRNGDIVVYVETEDQENRSRLVGVSLLEAKKLDPNSGYRELTWRQLDEILVDHPSAQLLLYSPEPVRLGREHGTSSCAATLPMRLARQLATRRPDVLHARATSLGWQLGMRFFFGCDLEVPSDDDTPAQVQAILRNLRVPFLLRASVSRGDTRTSDPSAVSLDERLPLPKGLDLQPIEAEGEGETEPEPPLAASG